MTEVDVTKLQDDAKPAGPMDDDALDLAKETLEDLDAPEEAADEARGGEAKQTFWRSCGGCE
jgi:hypothetical protein